MGYSHDRPQGFGLAFTLMRFVFGVAHLFGIIIENLTGNQHFIYSNKHECTSSMSSKPSGGAFDLAVLIFGMGVSCIKEK